MFALYGHRRFDAKTNKNILMRTSKFIKDDDVLICFNSLYIIIF